ncbi:MAG: hypothetical protein LBB40_01630 [Holophagales bacterium]|jgi:hypothetical protein|nr:hypothetical protein [Holophagales bacterium]
MRELDDLENAVASAFQDAGIPLNAAIQASRLATGAICFHLLGERVTFGEYMIKRYRDRAIYELSKTGGTDILARMEEISDRQIRNIVRKQRLTQGA